MWHPVRRRKGELGAQPPVADMPRPPTRRQYSTVRRAVEILVLNPAWELCAFEQFLPLISLTPRLTTSSLPGWKAGGPPKIPLNSTREKLTLQ